MLYQGDVFEKIKLIESASVQCVVTSPPYYSLRDYEMQNQIGLEKSYKDYLGKLKKLMVELRRVLKDDGTAWINLGDTYSSNHEWPTIHKNKKQTKYANTDTGDHYDLTRVDNKKEAIQTKTRYGIPERFYINCIDSGWIARNHIIWYKPDHLPSPYKDRFTNAYESIFFFAKNPKYYFNLDAIREPHKSKPKINKSQSITKNYDKYIAGKNIEHSDNRYHPNGRNPGDLWQYTSANYPGQHYASYPVQMIERIIQCSTKPGDTILDPFMGSGTTAFVAQKLHRNWIGIELNPEYCKLINERVHLTGGIDQFGM